MQGLLDVGGGQERVVLKRVKARVQGADEMVQMEHLINVRGWRRGRGGGSRVIWGTPVIRAHTSPTSESRRQPLHARLQSSIDGHSDSSQSTQHPTGLRVQSCARLNR